MICPFATPNLSEFPFFNVNSGPKMAENQRFEIAATATTFRRSHCGKQRLDGVSCQGRQPPEAGAKGQPLQGTPSSQT